MKKYIILFTSLILFIGCDDSSLEDQGINLEVIPGVYVALNPAGAVNTIAPFSVDEAVGLFEDINIEIPNNVNSFDNTTVTYTLGGTAVFGVDYTIDGATSAGGSIVVENIEGTNASDNLADNVDFPINILEDNVGDGEKSIIVTLVSASSPDGEVLVGRAGDNSVLTTATVIIDDLDYVAFSNEETTVPENIGSTTIEIQAFPGAVRTTDLTVEYTLSGTAVYGTDYTITGATAMGGVIINPAPTSAPEDGPVTFELDVQILTDAVTDGDKTIIATMVSANDGSPISVGVGGREEGNISTITIKDAVNSIAFNTESQLIEVAETDTSTNITIELHAGDDALTDVTVDYTLGGSAVYGVDYTITGATSDGGSVIITPGTSPTTLDLDVQLLTDAVSDGLKTITATLSSATLADGTELTLGVDGTGTTATIEISDIDFVSFNETSFELEVQESVGSIITTIEALTSVDINLNYSLSGTAVYGVDYTITGATDTGGSATIIPNATPAIASTVDLEVNILTDALEDGDKTIIITLDNASQVSGDSFSIGSGTSTITIKDVD